MRRSILASLDELQALRSRISHKPFDTFYGKLNKRCALILESAPMTEMNWQSAWASGRCNAALIAARGAQGRILDLVIADRIDANQAYRSRAVEELLNLVRWSTWVDPSRSNLLVDLCTAEAALAAVVGLDWLWDELDDEQRRDIIATLRRRVLDAYIESVSHDVWWYTAVNHWNAVINSTCGLVALVLEDEADNAAEVYKRSREGLQYFFDDLGREGGWDEGIGYWGYAVRFLLLFAEACNRLVDDQELLHHRGMDRTALFPIYFSPNGKPASFGDSAQLPLHGTLYLLGKYFDRREITWWLDTYCCNHDVSTMDWSQAGLAILFREEDGKVPPPSLEPVKTFDQIGWSAMADTWPRPSFYAAVKTGDLATSHAQRDMNSLQLQVDGEMLLIDVGNPPDEGSKYFSGARGAFYEVQARAHNTIIVAEEDHRPDAQGTIRDTGSDGNYRWVACDAGEACGEGVRFIRHVLMLTDQGNSRGWALVVLDELDLPAPERVDMFWHTGGRIEMEDGKLAGHVAGRQAGLHFEIVSTAPAKVCCGRSELEYGRADHFVQVTAGGIGSSYFASVFSREAISPALRLKPVGAGGVKLEFARTSILFKPARGYLSLEKVTTG